MNNEYNPERVSRLSLDYLNDELIGAIEWGDIDTIKEALPRQEKNRVTIALSNHLIERTFIVRQKGGLVALDSVLSAGASDDEIINSALAFVDNLRDDFTGTFVASSKQATYDKLSDDDAFREFLLMEDDDGVDDEDIDSEDFISSVSQAKWHLIETNASFLSSPSEVFEWAEIAKDRIVLSIDAARRDVEECGASEQSIFRLRKEILVQLDMLNDDILACFPQM